MSVISAGNSSSGRTTVRNLLLSIGPAHALVSGQILLGIGAAAALGIAGRLCAHAPMRRWGFEGKEALDDIENRRGSGTLDPRYPRQLVGHEFEKLGIRAEHCANKNVIVPGGDADEIDLGRPGEFPGYRAHRRE